MISMLNSRIKYILYLTFFVWFTGCMQEPKSDNAIIGEALPVEEKNEGVVFDIDTSQSIITWVGTKPTGRHNGLIKIKKGTITILHEELELKRKKFTIVNANICINMSSVKVLDLADNPLQLDKLEKHLHSKDFFGTEVHPEAEFELISFEPLVEDSVKREKNNYTIIDPTHVMNGNLTIKGKTLNVKFPVKADYRNLRLEASAKFNIDRTEWCINYNDENDPVARATDSFIHNIVNVGIEIIARPQSSEE